MSNAVEGTLCSYTRDEGLEEAGDISIYFSSDMTTSDCIGA